MGELNIMAVLGKVLYIAFDYKRFIGIARIFLVTFFCLPAFAQLNPDLLSNAEKGNATSQHLVGIAYYGGLNVNQDYKKAFEWFLKSANQNFPDAQTMLGTMYFKGQGVVKNEQKAINWMTKAANQGQAEAQTLLGSVYYSGGVLERNYKKAAEFYLKASNQNYSLAQAYLGEMYLRGQGVSQDIVKGCAWIYISENIKLNEVCAQILSSEQRIQLVGLIFEIKNNFSRK
jgi:TPR repeat protein